MTFIHCRHGAEEVREAESQPVKKGSAFKGSGYRLGDTEGTTSERISGEPMAAQRKQVVCFAIKIPYASNLLHMCTNSSL